MSGARVLVVEDDPDIVDYLSFFLEDEGFEVATAGRCSVAQEMMDEYQPQIVLIDALLPGKSGLELLVWLRRDPRWSDLPLVVIDYAHTPDALKQALMALRDHGGDKLVCVFGCGGDRDKGKRPLMGEIAVEHADEVVITDDNPRSESPAQIVDDIMQGVSGAETVSVVHDRARAIHQAIAGAGAEDIVLIAGKGHESFQQIGQNKIPFNDRNQAASILRSLK